MPHRHCSKCGKFCAASLNDIIYKTHRKNCQSMEQLAVSFGLLPSEAGVSPVKSLDKTTPAEGEVGVLGGKPRGPSKDTSECNVSLNIRLGDLTLTKLCKEYTQSYSFTFNYNPLSQHRMTKEAPKVYLTDASGNDTEELFWVNALGKPKKVVENKQFIFYDFRDQYELFKKHFAKWEKQINQLIPDFVLGYTVCIERTKQGVLHAHAIVYSNNNYVDMCSSTSRTVWAQIAKGKVCAMKDAFSSVKSEKSWKQYVTKDNNKII